MKIKVRGKTYTCGRARIMSLDEDGRKRLVLKDVEGEALPTVLSDLNVGEEVAITV